MKDTRAPLPRRYWVHLGWIILLLALLFAQIGLTVFLTEGRSISQFGRTEWMIFAAFLFSAAVIVIAAFGIAVSAGHLLTEHHRQRFLSHLHEGLDPAEYICILPDPEGDRRALVIRTETGYQLTIDQYDEGSGAWQAWDDPPVHLEDRMAIRQYLQEECDFFIDPEEPGLLP